MPVPQSGHMVGQPSCWTKLKMGFVMGAIIGSATGLVLGTFGSYQAGLRGRELFRQVGKVVAQSGGSFGVFMTVAQEFMIQHQPQQQGQYYPPPPGYSPYPNNYPPQGPPPPGYNPGAYYYPQEQPQQRSGSDASCWLLSLLALCCGCFLGDMFDTNCCCCIIPFPLCPRRR